MPLSAQTIGGNAVVLQAAIGMYSDEAYTTARKLSGTGIVSANPQIDTSTETFIGQLRWRQPLNPTINIASLTNAADGTVTNSTSDFSTYVKTVRTHGSTQVNMASVVTQEDGLAKIGRDFANTRAQDEHNAILAVLKGVALSELLMGAASGSGASGLGGQSFTNDPADKRYGFYVDLGAASPVIAATAAVQGADRASAFIAAMGMAWKDYEPEYAYLITSPEILASLRSANLVDSIKITDGSVVFDTIFQGKLRLIQTRAAQGFSAAELVRVNLGAGVDIIGQKTSFLVLPGALAMEGLSVPTPVELTRRGASYAGGGSTDLWYRWGYVVQPAGYDWCGLTTVFPNDAAYRQVISPAVNGGLPVDLLTAGTDTNIATLTGTWKRKASSALSLGILPIFHS
jgi:hypothetical protein